MHQRWTKTTLQQLQQLLPTRPTRIITSIVPVFTRTRRTEARRRRRTDHSHFQHQKISTFSSYSSNNNNSSSSNSNSNSNRTINTNSNTTPNNNNNNNVIMTISYSTLKEENATTSNAIIEHYASNDPNDLFKRLAQYEGEMTVARDDEDAKKLEKGITFAQKKGVLDPKHKPQPYIQVDVLGKTPDQVADQIIAKVQDSAGGGSDKKKGLKGSVIVLCGLSGTGKGTTVTQLREKLEGKGEKVVTWSNGNIFRSVTLLAATWCERNGMEEGKFDADKALTKENLEDYMSMLSFGKYAKGGTQFDTRIRGLGLELLVSEVQTTQLKSPKVSKNIPTVAEFTQGEVVLFAANAIELLGKDGWVVLLEGREQTVNYVPTPHRFTLTLSDDTLIGKRRAAQRLMGAAVKEIAAKKDETDATTDDEQVGLILQNLLAKMNQEIDEEDKKSTSNGVFCFKWGSKK